MTRIVHMKPDAKLFVGDTVQLRSGGPVMTVRSINGDMVQCRWFDVELTACCADFHTCELVAK